MITEITHGVKVSVETFYQDDYSNPVAEEYMFAYRITIENTSELVVKLLRRHWFIFDTNGEYREIQGDGVVGEQPILKSGEYHQYVSGCNLSSEMGRMSGSYTFERQEDGRLFEVTIPEFTLIAPQKMN